MLNERESRQVGKRIADYREKHSLSQNELAEMTGLTRNIVNQMELGKMKYKQGERKVLKPIAELFEISVSDLLVDIREEAEEDKEMESKLVKELTDTIKDLKIENKNLEERADMWKARVEELTKEKNNLLVSDDAPLEQARAEIERQNDYIKTLESKVKNLETNQKSAMEKLVLAMLEEKYNGKES